MKIRNFDAGDDVVALTQLLHRAYANQASKGLRFSATHQSPEVTQRRISRGYCFVLELDRRIIGTICLYPPDENSEVPEYRDPLTFNFGQYGIEPEFKGRGYGRLLHNFILAFAGEQGGEWMALDTAAPATDLVAMYIRWGYSEVTRCRWQMTNYESVIMKKPIKVGQVVPTESKPMGETPMPR
jgi:GNAT superfamily N-acetyltransferase